MNTNRTAATVAAVKAAGTVTVIRCEGRGQVAKNIRANKGECPTCGQVKPIFNQGTLKAHSVVGAF